MSGDPKLDQAETRAVDTLNKALAEVFKPGGTLDGYGFALWVIPPKERGGMEVLISNAPRPRVAEVVAGWMLQHKFAMGIPVPMPPTDAEKPN